MVVGSTLPSTPAVQERACGASPNCANGKGGIVLVHLLQGMLPTHRTAGTVLTDTSCDPDRYGISHCHNGIRLADGAAIVIRDDHDMQRNPCLSPGEKVWVEPVSTLS